MLFKSAMSSSTSGLDKCFNFSLARIVVSKNAFFVSSRRGRAGSAVSLGLVNHVHTFLTRVVFKD